MPGEKWMIFCQQTIYPSNAHARFWFTKLLTTIHIKLLSFMLLMACAPLRWLIACPLASSYGNDTQSIHLKAGRRFPALCERAEIDFCCR